MQYFSELHDGTWFRLGGVWCRKLSRFAYVVVPTGHQIRVGNGRFKVLAV